MTYMQKSYLLIASGILFLGGGLYFLFQGVGQIEPEILSLNEEFDQKEEFGVQKNKKVQAFVDPKGRIRMYTPNASFSDKESNKEYLEKLASGIANLLEKKSEQQSSDFSQKKITPKTITTLLETESFFGTFYMNQLLHSAQNCVPREKSFDSDKKTSRNPYTPDNFTLTKIEKNEDSAFLFVESTQVPESSCAQIIFLPENLSDTIKKVYVLVSNK